MLRKTLVGLGILVSLVVLFLISFVITVQLRWDRTFEVAYPEIHASDDPEVIEYGRYLTYGPAHCGYCHVPSDRWDALEAGETPALVGGYEWDVPPGLIRSPNLTPDLETGIGRRTDPELARAIRHNVRPDGRAAVPFMEFENMSDEDLVAVISYLRSQPPVRNEIPDHDLNLLGRGLMAFVIEPTGLDADPPRTAPPTGVTLERGAYLSDIAGCVSCHTERDMRDGSFTGPVYAGGAEFDSRTDPAAYFVAPNITPHATGVLDGWTEDHFVRRFRSGALLPGTEMPWGAYARMSDEDLRALYRYLSSLDPVENPTLPVLRFR